MMLRDALCIARKTTGEPSSAYQQPPCFLHLHAHSETGNLCACQIGCQWTGLGLHEGWVGGVRVGWDGSGPVGEKLGWGLMIHRVSLWGKYLVLDSVGL